MTVHSGSMGEFVFTPPGVDGPLLRDTRFVDIRVEDVTQKMDDIASRWRAARELHRAELDRIEGAAESAVFQRFLDAVAVLARERRLSRLAFVAAKP